jgi:hypothetical protein
MENFLCEIPLEQYQLLFVVNSLVVFLMCSFCSLRLICFVHVLSY